MMTLAYAESTVTAAARRFTEALEQAWAAHRAQEEEITRTYAPVSDAVAVLVRSIAATVSQVTGVEASVFDVKRSFRISTRGLVTQHCIDHPSGDFQVRVLYEPDSIQYHNERLELTQTEVLLERITRGAHTHFAPKLI